jgi:polyisoprenoid-binding protein YceI
MKTLFCFTCLFFILGATAQDNRYADSYVCQRGKVHFFSKSLVENIEATTQTALCVVNTKTKKVAAKIQQTSFQFSKKLMQEHFNENYMESDKYPTASMDMAIQESIDLTKDGTYDVTLKGTLEMHGVTKDCEIKGKMIVKNGQLAGATATFDVALADYKIKVPSVVGEQIASTIKVDAEFEFEKYQK